MMGRARATGKRKGFTFTLSMVILTLTLVAVATFAQQWRKDQQAFYTEIMPSESMHLRERVASDLGQMLMLDASLQRNNDSTTDLTFKVTEPFKREGLSIARMSDYSQSLPANLRNLGYEAVFSANNITGSEATVMHTTNNGSLVYSNNGPYDVATFYYPSGMAPQVIHADILCDKLSSTVSDLAVESNANSGYGYYYVVNYSELGGRNFVKTYYAPMESNATMSVIYPDSSLLYFESRFSPSLGSNRTSVHFTKSSGGALILPFDTNSTGVIRDYALFPGNISLAPGASAPEWSPDCGRGTGCYYFNGKNNSVYMAGGLSLTDAEVPAPIGSERIADPWIEAFDAPISPGDGQSDDWTWWYYNASSTTVFDAEVVQAQSGASLRVTSSDYNSSACFYQTVGMISPASPYVFSFWTKGGGARYQLKLSGDICLAADGNWTAGACGGMFATNPSSDYVRVTRAFVTPANQYPSLTVRLCPATGANQNVYYDSVTLKKAPGMNGGFENYYYQSGWQYTH
jgi:hypothetical protein